MKSTPAAALAVSSLAESDDPPVSALTVSQLAERDEHVGVGRGVTMYNEAGKIGDQDADAVPAAAKPH